MASPINKKILKHAAELARIELNAREEDRLLKDILNILAYFKELQELNTTGTETTGIPKGQNQSLRADNASEGTDRGAGVESFPETNDGFLKVPAVFERNNDEP